MIWTLIWHHKMTSQKFDIIEGESSYLRRSVRHNVVQCRHLILIFRLTAWITFFATRSIIYCQITLFNHCHKYVYLILSHLFKHHYITFVHTGSKIWRTLILFLAGAGAGITATASTYPFDIMYVILFLISNWIKYYEIK